MRRLRQSLEAMVLVIVLLVMSGCSGESGKAPGSQKEDEIIEISFLHRWSEESRKPYFDYLVESFEKEHPNVKINAQAVSNEAIKDKLRVMVGGEVPDIFFSWSGEFQKKFARAGVSLDLKPYLDKDPEWRDSFMEVVWGNCEYEDGIYGIPFNFNCELFTYNKEIYKECELSVPTTWSEFLGNCETLKKKGYTPLVLGNIQPWNGIHWLTNFNCRFVPEDIRMADSVPETGEFTDPGYVEALNAIKELYDKGYFYEGINSMEYMEQFELFCQGEAVMMSDDLQVFGSRYPGSIDEDKWGTFALPEIEGAKGNQKLIAGAPELFAVSSKTEHPEICVEFLKYMTNMENARKLVEDVGFVPCVKDVLTEENTIPQVLEGLEIAQGMDGFAEWIDTDVESRIADKYLSVGQEIFNGEEPEKLIKQIQEVAKTVAEENK